MVVADEHTQFIAQHGFAVDVPCGHGRAGEGDVYLALLQRGLLLWWCEALEDDLYLRISQAQCGDDDGKDLHLGGWDKPDGQALPGLLARGPGFGEGALHLPKHLAGFIQKHLSYLGQFHLARATDQQHHPQRVLQAADLLAQRGLRGIEALGGAGEVQLFSDRDEITQTSEVHQNSLRMSLARISVNG
ncbi:hypothetical protein SDC9_93495 [bioreactor metagenome]|uniref:Uncharacterized protein n=1 Tax=bioreactor metagenome TaxID=1076179 RepID=A0A645A0T3_9ZZZZ